MTTDFVDPFEQSRRRRIAEAAEYIDANPAIAAKLKVVDPAARLDWPEPMGSEAFVGLSGDFVRLVSPHSEADPVALLGNFLVGAGVLFGRQAWASAEGRPHYPVEFLLMVGKSGFSGRKGTATGRCLPVFEAVEENFSKRVLSGLSSGEGLIKALSAPGEIVLPAEVRRFLALLQEFASLLSVMERQGNIMSSILREAWDTSRLRVLTRKEPLDVDNVNLSVIAHITPLELLNNLTVTDRANGFGNRFLIMSVRRSKFLPEGGGPVNCSSIVTRLHGAVQAAKGLGEVERDAAAKELWAEEYPNVTREREGLRGELCTRADAHILRLSLLYALLDCSNVIRPDHLQAALAFWRYCENSILHVFGEATGDFDGEKILRALAAGPMTITELSGVFNRHRPAQWLQAKMAMLQRDGKVITATKPGDRKEAIPAWALKNMKGESE